MPKVLLSYHCELVIEDVLIVHLRGWCHRNTFVFRLWFSSQDTKSYLRCEAKVKTKNVLAIDCEMVACVPNEEWIKNARKPNKDEVKVAVHCAILDDGMQEFL